MDASSPFYLLIYESYAGSHIGCKTNLLLLSNTKAEESVYVCGPVRQILSIKHVRLRSRYCTQSWTWVQFS